MAKTFLVAGILIAAAALLASPVTAAPDEKGPGPTRIDRTRGSFVPIPADIPHAPGAHVDVRLIEQLRWITENYEVFVIEAFAGRLPDGEIVGCPECHVTSSEHKIGLAVDLIPLRYGSVPDNDYEVPCNRSWRDVTKLAKWAEPAQGDPVRPFRWVGYDGDYRHGCGDHLHLSWAHRPEFHLYEPSAWVRVFTPPPARLPLGAGKS